MSNTIITFIFSITLGLLLLIPGFSTTNGQINDVAQFDSCTTRIESVCVDDYSDQEVIDLVNNLGGTVFEDYSYRLNGQVGCIGTLNTECK